MAPNLPRDQILFVGSELVLPERVCLPFFFRAEVTFNPQPRPLPMTGWGCLGLLASGGLFNTYQVNAGLECWLVLGMIFEWSCPGEKCGLHVNLEISR